MTVRKIIICLSLWPFFSFLGALERNDSSCFELNGYLSSMQSGNNMQNGDWLLSNYLHNRLNFGWYLPGNFIAVAEMRNRFLFGDMIRLDPETYARSYDRDYGVADMSVNLTKGNSYLFNVAVDRLYLFYRNGKWDITVGRQRINWGNTFVWNPNDIFNAYSFFDFDYIERPGSDAVRIQYYVTETSEAEVAAKADASNNITAAGLYRFTVAGADVQFLGGFLSSADYVAGAGFSGHAGQVALRGEATFLHPFRNLQDTSGMVIVSAEADYTFENNLTLQGEYLFHQKPGIDFNRFVTLYNTRLDVKTLSFVKHNFFLQAGYPFTPLLKGTLAGMVFPQFKGFYLGPSFTYSLSDNLDFSFLVQAFSLELNGEHKAVTLAYMRLKLNF